MLHAWENLDISQCHGCGLCALVCPVYQQGGSVMATPHGMAKAKQAGGELAKDNVTSCVLCGACAAVCPQSIDLIRMLVEFRQQVSEQQQSIDKLESRPDNGRGKSILIADSLLLKHEEHLRGVMQLIGDKIILAADHATDISEAMQAGHGVSHARLHQFLTSLQSAKNIIVSDGLLYQLIRKKLPQIPLQSLGQTLSSLDVVKQNINHDDLYVMDSRSYHANYEEAVLHYDRLHKQSGCQLSCDLHRLAITVGDHSNHGFDQAQQVQWMLEGREVQRIVVESVSDASCLSDHCSLPVVHLLELALPPAS